MSVILDALKKLDREKSSRRNEPASIAVEILKPDLPLSRKKVSRYIALGTFTIIATAAITYAVIAKFGFLSKSSSPVPANLSAPGQQAPSASQETGILLKPSSPAASSVPPPGPAGIVPAPSPPAPARASREPVRDVQDKIDQVPPEVKADMQDDIEDEEDALSLRQKKTRRKVMPGKADVPPAEAKKTREPTPSGSDTALPSFKLSTIVWYEEPAKRFAVINGVISYEGSVIEGAKVVEIYPDRVRFVQNDRHFEVPMFK